MRNRIIPIIWMLVVTASVSSTFAQEPSGDSEDSPSPPPAVSKAPSSVDLHNSQKQIFRDYERFEKSLFDVAEQMRRKDPEQAEVLYRARSKSQEENLLADMELIAELLRSGEDNGEKKSAQYGPAVDRQTELLARMESILKLLKSLDARQRNAELMKQIQELLKDTNRTIAGQKDTRAETLRGRDSQQLNDAQQKVADQADELAKKIDQFNKAQNEDEESTDSKENHGDEQSEESEQKQGEDTQDSEEMKENKSSKESSGDEKQSSESGEEQKSSDGESKESSEGDPKSSDSKQQSEQQSQESQQSQQQSQSEQQQDQQEKSEQTPGREQLDEARKQMEKAIEDLLKDQKDDAVEHQDASVAHLEQLKAELEEILRQLREEEKETYLTLLEARFQNMLRRQLQINSETKRLNEIPEESRPQQSYVSKTNQIRKEQEDNAIDAEKALNLLREEGSSVAFPEAVEQMHQNMQVVIRRLAKEDTGGTTQLVETLVVETLEEMIDAFQKEMKKQEEQQQQQQGQQQQGQPQDPALVDQIAELKMIRSLQLQVNRITQQLGTEIDNPREVDSDQQELINDIAQRQKRIQSATYDLSVGKNK